MNAVFDDLRVSRLKGAGLTAVAEGSRRQGFLSSVNGATMPSIGGERYG
jgi:hypothetical protein